MIRHLGVLAEEGLLQIWNDRDIGVDDKWEEEIRSAFDTARVAVFLVSASSLNSKFLRTGVLPSSLHRVKEGMIFFTIILKSCVWHEIPWLAQFQARPQDGRPLASFQGDRRDIELAKIAQEILELLRNGSSLPRIIGSPKLEIVSTLPSLYQLPSPPVDFVGREKELAALRSVLAKRGTSTVLSLRGMGGIGKTTLALKLAEELKPLYPDAQFYLDLKGMDPQPLTTAQAMTHIIRSCHPEAQLPEDEIALAGLYRSVLFGKRTLLLMDNAASREQVEPLIPPKDSLLLVTSRFHFMIPRTLAKDLDELPRVDAKNLLLKIAPRIASEADAIARLCGRLPLALRLAGSALAERLDISPSDYSQL